ncbi:MAG: TatD family hydrolase [Clostridia bacterium]|nr:TatD family hydrolase [Clostridia bacterium]MDD3862977.1 TatD family hydrolase [Clostridia bacterium]MDD4408486.1 TatD family hydrolase [Clostridia bacterium]
MNEFLIDVHAHLNDERYNNLNETLKNAKQSKVEKIICVSYDFESSKKALKLSTENENIYAAIGIHPNNSEFFSQDFIDFLTKNYQNKKVVAIGEIGLDYHYENFDKEKQRNVFIAQLKLADTFGLPVQVHCRNAMNDTLEILTEHRNLLKNGGIMHCFKGSFENLRKVGELGLKISVGGVVTFKNAIETQELIEKVPLDMILFETDCPYLTPHPYRGKTNEPKFLELTVQKTAEFKDISFQKMMQISTENCYKIFKKLK